MLFSEISIRRPLFAIMINLAFVIFGLLNYSKISIDKAPKVNLPFVFVWVTWEGSSPTTVENQLLRPMEDILKTTEGLKSMEGAAASGNATVFLTFDLETPAELAFQRVREKISTFSPPKGTELPQIFKIQQDSEPFLTLRVSSEKRSEAELSAFIKNTLLPTLQQTPGVGSVYSTGTRLKELQISLLRSQITSRFLSPEEVKAQIEAQLVRLPAGKLSNPVDEHPISFDSTPTRIEQFYDIPIQLPHNDVHLRLGNIAHIEEALSDRKSYVEYDGKPTLTLSITKQPNGNMVKISEDVQRALQTIQKPDDVELSVVQDDSTFIRESIKAVNFDLIFGMLLAVLVVFIFLNSWKHTLITAISIPTSLIGTAAFIYWFDFSLNWMTLIALNLSIGILIDDAIVVIENIFRHQALHKSPLQAALDGTREIGLAAFSITLTLVAVFIPVAFMEGFAGKFFYEFGITVAVAVLISLFVAFTITPMLAGRLQYKEHVKTKGTFAYYFDIYFEKLKTTYLKYLQISLKNRSITLLSGLVVLLISLGLFRFLPVSQLVSDESRISFQFNLSPGTSIDAAISRGQEIAKMVREIPGVTNVIMSIGENGKKVNSVTFSATLVKPWERKYSAQELQDRVYLELKKFVYNPDEGFKTSEQSAPLKVIISGSNLKLIDDYAESLLVFMKDMSDVPLAYIGNDQKNFEYKIVPNLMKASDLKLSPTDIATNLKILFQGVVIGKFENQGDEIDIYLKLSNKETEDFNDLQSITLFNKDGAAIPLHSVARIEKTSIPDKIKHLDGQRRSSVSAQYSGKDLQKAMDTLEEHIKKTIPFGLTYKFDGASQDLGESSHEMTKALLLAIVFVFMILCVQFENLIAPSAILLSIPLCFSGAFLALILCRESLTMYAMIGLVMLTGLVTKNAILFVEFALQETRKNTPIFEALVSAGAIRLRPILMTTITMIVGMTPMLFDSSEGSEARFNIALTIVGGLISSTFLTLFIVPSGLSVLFSLRARLRSQVL